METNTNKNGCPNPDGRSNGARRGGENEKSNGVGKRYSVKPIVKPLPSHAAQEEPTSEPHLRDITEDDDGYHPYADVPDTRPLFERDPWR